MKGTALALASLLAGAAAAHDGAAHRTGQEAAAHELAAALPFPLEIEAAFDLVDQTGRRVTEADFRGAPLLLFFGYARCRSICGVALPAMAEALDRLGPEGARVQPVMITVDPADTPEVLARAMPRYHPRLLGLTGSAEALRAARTAFQVDVSPVSSGPDGDVLAHGSFVYLIGGDGRVRSVMPPILSADRISAIVSEYLRR